MPKGHYCLKLWNGYATWNIQMAKPQRAIDENNRDEPEIKLVTNTMQK